MALPAAPLVAGLFSVGEKLIDRLFPDPETKAKAQRELDKLEQEGELASLSSRLSVIAAEAGSDDRWTSRARPTFLYVFYVVILNLVLAAPLVGVFYPEQMTIFFANVKAGFDAIPEELWWLFGTGYLGYSGFRTIEKRKKINSL